MHVPHHVPYLFYFSFISFRWCYFKPLKPMSKIHQHCNFFSPIASIIDVFSEFTCYLSLLLHSMYG